MDHHQQQSSSHFQTTSHVQTTGRALGAQCTGHGNGCPSAKRAAARGRKIPVTAWRAAVPVVAMGVDA
jgi:hypothetical protein